MVSGTCPEPSLHVSQVTALGLNKHVVGISVLAEACVCLVLSVWKKDRADDPATCGKICHNGETYRTNSKEKATLCNYCSSAAIGEDKLVTSSLLVICSIVPYEWNWVCFIYSAQNVKLQFASEDLAVRKMQIKQNTNMIATMKQNHSLFLKQGHLVVSCLHRMVVVVGGGWGGAGVTLISIPAHARKGSWSCNPEQEQDKHFGKRNYSVQYFSRPTWKPCFCGTSPHLLYSG